MRRPRVSVLLGVAASAALTAVTAVLGLDLGHAVVFGGGVLAVGTMIAVVTGMPHEDDLAGVSRTTGAGARQELARLAWSMLDRRGPVTAPARRRARAAAADALADRGVLVDEPGGRESAARLLGAANAAVLFGDPGTRVPLHRLDRALAAVEQLARTEEDPA